MLKSIFTNTALLVLQFCEDQHRIFRRCIGNKGGHYERS